MARSTGDMAFPAPEGTRRPAAVEQVAEPFSPSLEVSFDTADVWMSRVMVVLRR